MEATTRVMAATESTVSTGVIILTGIAVAIPLIVVVSIIHLDYRRHKKPLQEADPNVHYTFWHHVKVVTIPLLSYRVTFMIQKRDK